MDTDIHELCQSKHQPLRIADSAEKKEEKWIIYESSVNKGDYVASKRHPTD